MAESTEFRKDDLLKEEIEHLDMKKHDVVALVDDMSRTAFQARNLSRAARIYDMMLADPDCKIILTMAGSLFSAGLKKIVHDMVMNNMVDAIVSTGAVIVDMDFFEAIGFKHYIGTPFVDDNILRELSIDRIYDTFIDEEQLRICDQTVKVIADKLEKRPYSSREFIGQMGKYLDEVGPKVDDSVVHAAYKMDVPIFCPAFSDCSAGFGLLDHQRQNPEKHLSIDSVADFRELVALVTASKQSGIFMIGGGVPKNFVQDTVLGVEVDPSGQLLEEVRMHKYAIQITVADERDGALSGSTLKEASSWGKVETTFEQMVWAEATIALPLIAGYGYHKGSWKGREPSRWSKLL